MVVILTLVLYLLIFFIRFQQGGWDINIDVLNTQRQFLDQKISEFLPSPQAELLSGIILGQNKQLPGQFRLDLRDTSTLHIVVASGQNLSILAGFFLLLSGLIKTRGVVVLSSIAVISYVLLVGAQVPVLRAAVMIGMGFLAHIIGREKDSIWILIVTGALMLLVNPFWLFDLSFQLSFLATIGVIVVAPIFLKYLSKLPNFLKQDLAVSFGAQLMVFPIIAQNFHQLSLVALPANLLVLWTVPIIMILGVGFLILSLIFPFAGWIIAFVLNVALTYFVYIVQFFGKLSFAWEYVGEQVWVVWVGYYCLLAGIVVAMNKNDKIQRF